MNLDNTFNKLQTLGEYIEDTEDYIQFDLDTKRNKFIEVGHRHRCQPLSNGSLAGGERPQCSNLSAALAWCSIG